ncbi:MAG: dTDP-4-dehydrorhamnose reductase [Chloroflexota bacterium]|nr:dTDP-4-dehydrorhamnose reductase [Chloroflexota bacterium]
MRILLLGKHGQLGWELHRTLAPLGEVTALDFPEIDLSQPETIPEMLQLHNPQLVINATAYTAVDRAENEPDIAMAVNARSPGMLAEYTREIGAALIHYSTDYVFDGTKNAPYLESDEPNPINVYGKSKLAGEQAVQNAGDIYLVLRTSWVYSMRADSFVSKVLRWSHQQESLRIVTDQISNPTWARMLAETTAQMLAKANSELIDWLGERRGLYHLAGWGYTNRLKWAQSILKFDPAPEEQLTRQIIPAVTSDFPTAARRPLFSALDCERFASTFGLRLPDWQPSLQLAMEAT